jgi:integrase
MPELLAPIYQLVDIPLAQLPTATAWQRLSPHWPAPEDRELPGQWDAKVRLFQYLAKAWGAISDESYRALCGDLRLFLDWCRARGLPALPASPQTVGAFLVDQSEIKAKSTVQRYLASIARAHKVAGLGSPVAHEDVTLVYERQYRDDTSEPRQSEGLRWETLSGGLANLGEDARAVRDNALMRVMYDCLLRASEVRSLTLDGLSRDRNGYRLRVIRAKKRSKAQQGVVKTKFVHETTAAAIEAWCVLAGIDCMPKFMASNMITFGQEQTYGSAVSDDRNRPEADSFSNQSSLTHCCQLTPTPMVFVLSGLTIGGPLGHDVATRRCPT